MAVLLKKNEKISEVVNGLENDFTESQFLERFKEIYPKDWAKINREYTKHERNTKPGNSHPMPNPEQYLINALNVWKKLK
jgi:hypothetical protein